MNSSFSISLGITCLFVVNHVIAADIQPVGNDRLGFSQAVIVKDQALAHTTQLYPTDDNGKVVKGDVQQQTSQLLVNLQSAFNHVGSNFSQLVRLNLYISQAENRQPVLKQFKEQLPKDARPVVTVVVTTLAYQSALLAADAIVSVPNSHAPAQVRYYHRQRKHPQISADISVLPKGGVVYISGMAERTNNLSEATSGTLRQLDKVLKHLGLNHSHVISVKAFLKPMSNLTDVEAAMETHFGNKKVPPASFVEWTNGLPIEIEMIAAYPQLEKQPGGLQHRWLPGEKKSPVYCRFATVNHSTRIYISGLLSKNITSARSQVKDIFAQLKVILEATDSNFQQMVKATYYVAANDVSTALNSVRPELYNPQRPPAASKAGIVSTGDDKRTISIDMIAVPAK